MIQLENYTTGGFDRGASRIKEAGWWLVRLMFFAPGWPWPSGVRAWWLRVFGAKVGRGVVIRERVNISFPWRLYLGDHVWIGEEVMILSLNTVEIGSHVCISQRAMLCTGSHNYRRSDFALMTAPIKIGDGCWVAAGVFVGPGVTIGEGAVIGAWSAVVRDIPSGMLAAGHPARPLRPVDRDEE